MAAQRRRRKDNATRTSPMTIDDVARRAYEIFLTRGGGDGHDLEDWLQAETELLAQASTGQSIQRERAEVAMSSSLRPAITGVE